MVEGPVESIAVAGGGTAPLYLLRFDKDGLLLSSKSAAHLRETAAAATDIFVFSHGWNNTFDIALARYKDFIGRYAAVRAQHGLPTPSPYRPVLMGVVWPSTSFVFPWESGPDIAARGSADAERFAEELQQFVASELDIEAAGELSELVDGVTELPPRQAKRAAELVQGLVEVGDEGGVAAPTVDDILDAWAGLEGRHVEPADPDDFGTVDDAALGGASGEVEVAGLLSAFDPRNLLRMATVWTMKKRAGVIGTRGVGPLLEALLDGSDARVHLVGHSFGAKVVLSAVAAQRPQQRQVHSMLLLQAAINRWCFADNAAGTGRPGGYRDVPDRVVRPILTTRSRHDVPLTTVFQLVMRGSHVGEPDIAAIGNEHRYGALGGFGPAGLDAANLEVAITDPVDRYNVNGGHKVLTIVGDRTIEGHGEVSNESTAWALHCVTPALTTTP